MSAPLPVSSERMNFENDKMSLEFGRLFEEKFLKQGKEEEREIGYSLDMAWEILSTLPRSELTRVSLDDIREHIKTSGN